MLVERSIFALARMVVRPALSLSTGYARVAEILSHAKTACKSAVVPEEKIGRAD